MKTLFILLSVFFAVKAQGVAYYDEIRDLQNQPDILLIDVREPSEIEQTGLIPTSINIPAAQLEWAFNLSPAKFEAFYNRRKPQLADPIITTCRSGRRAQTAAERLVSWGYTNVRFYEGSWLEWCVKEEKICGE